jgi:hypothetical protein
MMATLRSVGASSFVLTLACLLGPSALGDPIPYETSATVDHRSYPLDPREPGPRDVVGPDVVSFRGVSGTLDSSAPIQIGEFVVSPVAGSSSTYYHIPFSIEVHTPSLDRFAGVGDPEPGEHVGSILIGGHLDGMVDAAGRSDLKASFDSVRLDSNDFARLAVGYYFEFPLPLSDVKLPGTLALASESGGGQFAIALEINPVPEPAPIALLLAASALFICRRTRSTEAKPRQQV